MSFTSLNDVLGKLGFESEDKPKTEEEFMEERRKYCEWQCKSANELRGELDKADGYDCPLCLNKGYRLEPRPSGKFYDTVFIPCTCESIRKTMRALKESGLSDLAKEFRFDNFEVSEPWQQTMLDRAKAYLEADSDKWLYMGGNTGCGKSHICTAVAVALLKQGKEVKYMLWRDEVNRLKALVNEGSYADEIKHYKNVDVLYIDDLFKTGKCEGQKSQRPTAADINLAFEILNSRAIKKLPTIISSESTLTELLAIDDAIAGRIKQRCGVYNVNIARDASKNFRLK
ncbi:MAG: ATP-binding protein [Clostridia bacterium]|nr:ATP-binding protein [Clostridia bacterium]